MPPDKGLAARPRTPVSREVHPPCSITVVVAGGSVARWRGLSRCLSKEAGFVLLRCSSSLEEAFRYCQKLAPCVLIVDQTLIEKLDPVEFGATVDFGRAIQVLASVETDDARALENLLRIGCAGYLQGEPSSALLRRAVRTAAVGELWGSRKILSRIVRSFLLAESPRKLTRREQEILQLIALGHKNREIADQLFISRETVRWHMRSLYAKIGVQDRLSAAFHAWEHLSGDANTTPAVVRKPPESLRPPKVAAVSVG